MNQETHSLLWKINRPCFLISNDQKQRKLKLKEACNSIT